MARIYSNKNNNNQCERLKRNQKYVKYQRVHQAGDLLTRVVLGLHDVEVVALGCVKQRQRRQKYGARRTQNQHVQRHLGSLYHRIGFIGRIQHIRVHMHVQNVVGTDYHPI